MRQAASGVAEQIHEPYNSNVNHRIKTCKAARKLQRITNVDPLPDKVLKRLYAQEDDDAKFIRVFMAAQTKAVEE
jgi:hypothetical protein